MSFFAVKTTRRRGSGGRERAREDAAEKYMGQMLEREDYSRTANGALQDDGSVWDGLCEKRGGGNFQ